MITEMVDNLRALGVREGGVLMVHASLRSLGQVDGGAETVILGLLEVLGKSATLLLPALSYATVDAANPNFDVLETPSCVGALPEYFRLRKGTLRSIHPTHSVCGAGALAEEILYAHEFDQTPCGYNSPFHKLRLYEGQVLFIGCGLRPNTSMHAIEEFSEPPYLFSDEMEYHITDAKGKQTSTRIRRHNFNGWEQRYDRLADVMATGIQTGKVLEADCHLVEATEMWRVVRRKLQENPLYFVDRV
jgi:aminoglycoside 3-N-acetyltransferase